MVLYCTHCMCHCPTPTLHLNLATGDCAFLPPPPPQKKHQQPNKQKQTTNKEKNTHSVWFISVLKNGDMGQSPDMSPSPCNTCVIIQIHVLICHKNTQTHTPEHFLNTKSLLLSNLHGLIFVWNPRFITQDSIMNRKFKTLYYYLFWPTWMYPCRECILAG